MTSPWTFALGITQGLKLPTMIRSVMAKMAIIDLHRLIKLKMKPKPVGVLTVDKSSKPFVLVTAFILKLLLGMYTTTTL